jgi:1,4-alpha-glucan branching enzyme
MKTDLERDSAAANLTRDRVPVRFEFIHPTAGQVAIAGSFNEWQPETRPLRNSGAGRWWNEIELTPGRYEYCLVVDGKWIPDPLADETVPNPYGGRNSVVTVTRRAKAGQQTKTKGRPSRKMPTRKATRV